MSKDNWAIKPEADVDKASKMGNTNEGSFNTPFVPLEGLPSKERAEQVEQQRIAINAKDTIRLERGTLLAFAAAQWVTKIEFQAVMSHIRILEAEKNEYRAQAERMKKQCTDLQHQVTYLSRILRGVETKWGTIKHFANQIWCRQSHVLNPIEELKSDSEPERKRTQS